MAYTPTEWKTGDVITAEKLNNIEQGILNAPGVAVFEFEVITDNDNQVVTDVTVQDVIDAYSAGKLCVASYVTHPSAMPADANPKTLVLFEAIQAAFGYVRAVFISIARSGETTGRVLSQRITGDSNGWTYKEESLNFVLS